MLTCAEAILHFDGGIRNGIMAYGWVLTDIQSPDVAIATGHKKCGKGTSNISEYRALIAGLQGALNNSVDVIHIFGDSQLVIKQVSGVFSAKKKELREHRDFVLKLLEKFDDHTIKWVPREENTWADELVNRVFGRKSVKCTRKKRQKRKRR